MGRKESGKDVLASALLTEFEKLGLRFKRLAMADALKAEVAEAVKIPVEALASRKAEFRPLLQFWGTEFRRNQDPNYWVTRALATMRDEPDMVHGYIIPDVRFENEHAFVVQNGGLIVRVWRCKNSFFSRLWYTLTAFFTDAHASETNWSSLPADYDLFNDASPEAVQVYAAKFADMVRTELLKNALPRTGRFCPYTMPAKFQAHEQRIYDAALFERQDPFWP